MVAMFLLAGKAKQGVFTTGRLMRRISVAFSDDVVPYVTWSLLKFYEKVRALPYQEDPASLEFLQRPSITLALAGPGGDCDDKAICMGAFFYLQKIPYRFVAASRSFDAPLHHTWCQGYIEGSWLDCDPTYAWNALGERVGPWPKVVVIG